jgi:hypothetical protein
MKSGKPNLQQKRVRVDLQQVAISFGAVHG